MGTDLNLQNMDHCRKFLTPSISNTTTPQKQVSMSCQTEKRTGSSLHVKQSRSVPRRSFGFSSTAKRYRSDFTGTDCRQDLPTSCTLTATESEQNDENLTEREIVQHSGYQRRTEIAGDEDPSRIEVR